MYLPCGLQTKNAFDDDSVTEEKQIPGYHLLEQENKSWAAI